jgi:hypothetical protein
MKPRNAGRPKIAPPTRRRQHRMEEDAERFFTPFQVIENPDWLVGAY